MNKKWFKNQFKKIKKPQSALAEMLNVEPSAISRALNGTRRFKADEVPAIAQFFNTSIEDIIAAIQGKAPAANDSNHPNTITQVPLLGQINTLENNIIASSSENEPHQSISIRIPEAYTNQTLLAYTVHGNNLLPFINDTDLVFLKTDDLSFLEQTSLVLHQTDNTSLQALKITTHTKKNLQLKAVLIKSIQNH